MSKVCRFIPLLAVGLVYMAGFVFDQERTVAAFAGGAAMLKTLAGPLCMVFLMIVLANRYLQPEKVASLLGRQSGLRGILICIAAGIVSLGPVMAWYPLMKDLREKGAADSRLSMFLCNRSIKPVLLPVMISTFGWLFTLLMTIFTVFASLVTGWLVGRISAPRRPV